MNVVTLPPIDALVRGFARFMSAAWDEMIAASRLSTVESFIGDWQQANWEMLVEGALAPPTIRLEIYGSGADCNAASSRVYLPDAVATHAVICHPKLGREVRDVIGGAEIDLGEGDDDREFGGGRQSRRHPVRPATVVRRRWWSWL